MALPKTLKSFNVFNAGNNHIGLVEELTLPKLTRKTEDWRGGGMGGSIKLDFGQEAITLDATYGGIMRGILEQYGVTKHDGVQVRFAGAYRSEDADRPDAIEIVVRGRHTEIDMGTAKAGDKGTFKVSTACSYYKLTFNGQTVIEIDLINMIEIVNGQDLLADIRNAIGL
ncbi:phage major tail tube protein [Paraburkholderia sediminicola]|uniref:phage major tail tube protein n=1 Tax=Paraburkholderia sediminicola TaxID=458836 RepID=UPI0038B8C44D